MDEEENDNVGGVGALSKKKENSLGKDPRTLEASVKRWNAQKKRKEKKWKRKKKKKRNMKHRSSFWWTKCKEQVTSFFVSERKEEAVQEKGRKKNKSPRTRQVLGKSGRWLFLHLTLMQKWLCFDAGWSQKGKRRCRRSLSCRMRSEAPKWTWMADGKASEKGEAGKRS